MTHGLTVMRTFYVVFYTRRQHKTQNIEKRRELNIGEDANPHILISSLCVGKTKVLLKIPSSCCRIHILHMHEFNYYL